MFDDTIYLVIYAVDKHLFRTCNEVMRIPMQEIIEKLNMFEDVFEETKK